MAKPRRATGQLTFRCDVPTHEQLLEVAGYLGIDLNGLLNQMIREAMPSFFDKAKSVVERYRAARAALDAVAIPTEDPVLRLLLLEALRVPAANRLPVLQDAARRYSRPGDSAANEVVLYAQRLLEKAEALERLNLLTSQQGTWSFDMDEARLIGDLRSRLQADLMELNRKWEATRARDEPEEPPVPEEARRPRKKPSSRPRRRSGE